MATLADTDDHNDMCQDFNCSSHGRMNRLYASLVDELEAVREELEQAKRYIRQLEQEIGVPKSHL